MHTLKAYDFLRALSKVEMIEFGKFIKSPFCNKSNNVIKLFESVKKHYPDFRSHALKPEKLYSKVFNYKQFHNRSLNNLFTRLINLIENYFIHKQFSHDNYNRLHNLLVQLRNRKLETAFSSTLKKSVKEISIKSLYDPDHFLMRYKLKQTSLYYTFLKSPPDKLDPLIEKLADATGDLLSFYYLNSCRDFFRLMFIMRSISSNKNLDNRLQILQNTVYESNILPDIPVFNIYKLFIGIFDSQKKSDYFLLKKSLLKIQKKISESDFNFLLVLLYEYGNSLIQDGNKPLELELFNHAKLILARKIWTSISGIKNELIFNNILNNALRVNEFSWSENFINSYNFTIDKSRRLDAVNISMAELYFRKAQYTKSGNNIFYNKSIEYLAKFKAQDFYSKCHIFNLIIMIYYETDELEYLYYQCDSFLHYLNEHYHDISVEIFKKQVNFSKYCLRLTKIKQLSSKESIIDFKNNVASEKFCESKDWLLKKAAELNKIDNK